MALVGMEHLGGRHPGQLGVGLDRAGAADAQQQFLQQAVLAAAAVEAVGDAAQLLRVLGHVGVEQQQAHAPDRELPDAGGQAPRRRAGRARRSRQSRRRCAARASEGRRGRAPGSSPPASPRARSPGGSSRPGRTDRRRRWAPRDPTRSSGDRRPGCRGRRCTAGAPPRSRIRARSRRSCRGRVVHRATGTSAARRGTRRRSSRSPSTRATNAASAASSASRALGTSPRRPIGSLPCSAHRSGATSRNRSRVGWCHDQRRLAASSSSAFSDSGRTVRTVNRRMAFTRQP